jgi:hypothetical protein
MKNENKNVQSEENDSNESHAKAEKINIWPIAIAGIFILVNIWSYLMAEIPFGDIVELNAWFLILTPASCFFMSVYMKGEENSDKYIKIFVSIITLLWFCLLTGIAPLNDKKSNNVNILLNEYSNDWFEGGALHTATVQEWKIASEENKLATCADWICAWEKAGLTTKNYSSMNSVKLDAQELKAFLNEALQPISPDDSVNSYATLGAISLRIVQR